MARTHLRAGQPVPDRDLGGHRPGLLLARLADHGVGARPRCARARDLQLPQLGLTAPATGSRHDGLVVVDAVEAVRNAHVWFETNSGWAPPDADTLAEWVADGVCRCPDDCLVAPEGWCEHG